MLDTLQMISKASFGGVELILMAPRFNSTKWIELIGSLPGFERMTTKVSGFHLV